MAKKSVKQQIMDDIRDAGKISVLRNTKASRKVLEAGKSYNVPADVSVEDAFELVAVVRKAVIGDQKKSSENKQQTVEELKAEAKDLGIEGYHTMKKADLIIAITTAKDE